MRAVAQHTLQGVSAYFTLTARIPGHNSVNTKIINLYIFPGVNDPNKYSMSEFRYDHK